MPKTTTITEEIPTSQADASNVIAYRVGQLETTVKEGFRNHNEKLDKLITSFATKAELTVVQTDIAELKASNKLLVATDNRQEGAIDTTRRFTTIGLSLLSILVIIVGIYIGARKH